MPRDHGDDGQPATLQSLHAERRMLAEQIEAAFERLPIDAPTSDDPLIESELAALRDMMNRYLDVARKIIDMAQPS